MPRSKGRRAGFRSFITVLGEKKRLKKEGICVENGGGGDDGGNNDDGGGGDDGGDGDCGRSVRIYVSPARICRLSHLRAKSVVEIRVHR